MTDAAMKDQLRSWRDDEASFYGGVLNDPDLYMASVKLVRSVTDSLAPIKSLEALYDRYQELDASYVVPLADAMEIPQLVFLNYDLVLATSFSVRSGEIQEEKVAAQFHVQIEAAREAGDEWVELLNSEMMRNGRPFFRKIEMHVPSGLALQTANELDWEVGILFALDPLQLDPTTGRTVSNRNLLDKRTTYASREELEAAAAALKLKFASEQKEMIYAASQPD